MPSDDHVDPGGIGRDLFVHLVVGVAEHDDLVDPFGGQLVDLGLHRRDRLGEGDVLAGARDLVAVLGRQPDQADPLAADLDHGRFPDRVGQQRLARDIGVRHQHREVHRVDEAAQHLGAVVEFVVAHGHRVIAQLVHHLGRQLALVIGVEQRALELVAAIDQQRIAGARAGRGDRGRQPRRAAEAFAGRVVLCRAVVVVFGDRLETGVKVVRMQYRQLVLGERRRRGHGQGRSGQEQSVTHMIDSLIGFSARA